VTTGARPKVNVLYFAPCGLGEGVGGRARLTSSPVVTSLTSILRYDSGATTFSPIIIPLMVAEIAKQDFCNRITHVGD